jgi:hypothetical protein
MVLGTNTNNHAVGIVGGFAWVEVEGISRIKCRIKIKIKQIEKPKRSEKQMV